VRLHGDRDQGVAGLQALSNGEWDACVDLSGYLPAQVAASVQMLSDRVQHYVFMSSVAVYKDVDPAPIFEDHPLKYPAPHNTTEIDAVTYGTLKVACENIVRDVVGERTTILRPQGVAGPYDPSGRHTWWLWRAAQGGEMLAPGDGTDHVQLVDVRDLAGFTVAVVEQKLVGTYNVSGPRITWRHFMSAIHAKHLVWVPAPILLAAQLSFMQLPLFRPHGGHQSRYMNLNSDRAQELGLTQRSAIDTARDTREWSLTQQYPEAITRAQEAELIALAREGN
jgi:2'-hydroxyisoflavone reductase